VRAKDHRTLSAITGAAIILWLLIEAARLLFGL
jgi:hypothetical protein